VKTRNAVIAAVIAVVLACIAYGTYLVRRGFSATAQPSGLETFVARTVRGWAIPSGAKNEKNPWADKATPEVMTEARDHYADHCATCHANDGSGDTEIGQGLYPKAPDMRLPRTQNLTDGEIYYIIENGVRLTGMPAWGNPAKQAQDDDSWKLVLFIRHLPKLTPGEINDMEAHNPKTEAEREEEQQENDFLSGKDSGADQKSPKANPGAKMKDQTGNGHH